MFGGISQKKETNFYSSSPLERIEIENISSNNGNGLPSTRKGNWKKKINKVAKSKLDESKKFKEIDQFAYFYNPSKKEVSEFVVYIIDQYTTQQYLKKFLMIKKCLKTYLSQQSFIDIIKTNKVIRIEILYLTSIKTQNTYTMEWIQLEAQQLLLNERQMDKALEGSIIIIINRKTATKGGPFYFPSQLYLLTSKKGFALTFSSPTGSFVCIRSQLHLTKLEWLSRRFFAL